MTEIDLRYAQSLLELTAMQRRHVAAVMRIEKEVYPQPWSSNLFLAELDLPESRDYTVALVDGDVAGYSGVLYVGDEAHVTTIAVDPAFQGRGIGSHLMLRNARLCLDHSIRSMTLEVRVSNEAAQALYRRFGFAPAGVRKAYYSNPPEDALVMWVHDIDSPEYAGRLQGVSSAHDMRVQQSVLQ